MSTATVDPLAILGDAAASRFPQVAARGIPVMPATLKRTFVSGSGGRTVHRVATAATVWPKSSLPQTARWVELAVLTRCGVTVIRPRTERLDTGGRLCQPCLEADGDWCVYGYYGCDGAPLYVGMTGREFRRMEQHKASSPWWPAAADAKILGWFDTEHDAHLFELRLIAGLRPRHNSQGRYVA